MSMEHSRLFVERCWFCGQPVTKGKEANKHHVIPVRYRVPTPIKLVHVSCHNRAHCELDNPRWSLDEFIDHMIPIDFGDGIFAGD